MSEPEPMRQIHEIQEKIYEKTKHMSDKEFLSYIHKQSKIAQKRRNKIKPAKDLKTFFAKLKNQQAS